MGNGSSAGSPIQKITVFGSFDFQSKWHKQGSDALETVGAFLG